MFLDRMFSEGFPGLELPYFDKEEVDFQALQELFPQTENARSTCGKHKCRRSPPWKIWKRNGESTRPGTSRDIASLFQALQGYFENTFQLQRKIGHQTFRVYTRVCIYIYLLFHTLQYMTMFQFFVY